MASCFTAGKALVQGQVCNTERSSIIIIVSIIILILQMRKLRLREVALINQSHTAKKQQSQNSYPDLLGAMESENKCHSSHQGRFLEEVRA